MGARKILRADDGMVLTNGTDYGKIIYLADGVDGSEFYSITQEEYEALMESPQAAEEDYRAALSEMGVSL